MNISTSKFINSSSVELGGAVSARDSLTVLVSFTEFLHCSADDSGGAISTVAAKEFAIHNCLFVQNIAYGAGGGAVFGKSSPLILEYSTFLKNIAPKGGGGCLFWDGPFDPSIDFSADVNIFQESIGSFNEKTLSDRFSAAGNEAAYGSCLASTLKKLLLSEMPTRKTPAYPGLPLSLSVLKKDAYNQTIITDSSTVLFSQSAQLGDKSSVDPFLASLHSCTFRVLPIG